MTAAQKKQWLAEEVLPALREIPAERPPLWGKMNLQQMIEHLSVFVRIASGKSPHTQVINEGEVLAKARSFMLSDKPFRENTGNPLLPDTPPPPKHASKDTALAELEYELHYFFDVFEKEGLEHSRNPIFGDLSYEENLHLLCKHILHHLRQFATPTSVG